MKQIPQFQLLDCPRTGPDKWAEMTIWSDDHDSARYIRNFDSLSKASDHAHEMAPFLREGCKITIKHGETITYTIERI